MGISETASWSSTNLHKQQPRGHHTAKSWLVDRLQGKPFRIRLKCGPLQVSEVLWLHNLQ
jgi:hypothetical protein